MFNKTGNISFSSFGVFLSFFVFLIFLCSGKLILLSSISERINAQFSEILLKVDALASSSKSKVAPSNFCWNSSRVILTIYYKYGIDLRSF